MAASSIFLYTFTIATHYKESCLKFVLSYFVLLWLCLVKPSTSHHLFTRNPRGPEFCTLCVKCVHQKKIISETLSYIREVFKKLFQIVKPLKN